MYRQSVVSVF